MWLLTGSIAIGCAWCLTRVGSSAFAFWSYVVLGLIALAACLCRVTVLVIDALDNLAPEERAARATVNRIVSKHLDTLARRRVALVSIDHYGLEETEAWDKELRRFLSKVIKPELSEEAISILAPKGKFDPAIADMINERVGIRAKELEARLMFDEDMTPLEFEQWVAAGLAKSGWRTRTVGGTGDQGADVIAERDGLTAVIQCKLYSSPVGNKAVQEAFAARRHHSASVAAVVTNGGFTPSARRLAATTGVLLLLHSEIERFEEMLEKRSSNQDREPALAGA